MRLQRTEKWLRMSFGTIQCSLTKCLQMKEDWFRVFSHALVQVPESTAYIACIAQITLKFINFTFVNLISCTLSSRWILSLTKTGWMTMWVFKLRSFSCLRTKSAESWSLKGSTVRTVEFSFLGRCWLRVTFFKKITTSTMISDMHGQAWFSKSSFISYVDMARVVEHKTRVSRFYVDFGLNLRSSVKQLHS